MIAVLQEEPARLFFWLLLLLRVVRGRCVGVGLLHGKLFNQLRRKKQNNGKKEKKNKAATIRTASHRHTTLLAKEKKFPLSPLAVNRTQPLWSSFFFSFKIT